MAKRSLDYHRFKLLVSCYDWRLSTMGATKRSVYHYAEKLRRDEEKGVIRLSHIKYLAPLGIQVVYGVLYDNENADLVLEAGDSLVNTQLRLPYNHYIHSVSVLSKKKLFVSWYEPPGIRIPVEELNGEFYRGTFIPLHNCVGRETEQPTEEEIAALGSHAEHLLRIERLRLRTPILAYAVTAVLDRYPMASLREIGRLTRLLAAREPGEVDGEGQENVDGLIPLSKLELREKYTARYYKILSASYVLGRILVYEPQGYITHALLAPRECLPQVYTYLALSRASTRLYVSPNGPIAAGLITRPGSAMLANLLKACPDIVVEYKFKTISYPFPYELYNPIENRWETRPVTNILRILQRLRLVSRNRRLGE